MGGVGAESLVERVADASFQAARRFLAGLPLGLFLQVLGAAGSVVADLTERGDVERVVELAVPVRVQTMPFLRSRRRFDGRGRVVAGVVPSRGRCSHGSNLARRTASTSTGHATQLTTTTQTTMTTADPVFNLPRLLRSEQQARARAEVMCRATFGSRFLNSAPGTVAEVHMSRAGPGAQLGKDAFPGASPRALTAWCWVGRPGDYSDYAVGPGSAPVFMGGVAGAGATTAPQPGPPVYPYP